MPGYRYSRWDGSQEALFLNEDALMDRVSDQLLANGDVTAALRDLARQGLPVEQGGAPGLQDLLDRLRQRRQDILSQHQLSSLMDSARRRLEAIRDREREGIARQEARGRQPGPGLDAETSERLLRELERRIAAGREAVKNIPWERPGKAIERLRDYEFTDPEARKEFDELLREVGRQAADTLYEGLSQELRDLTRRGGVPPSPSAEPQARTLGPLKDMLRDLNGLLQHHLQAGADGAGLREAFRRFMDAHGARFGDTPSASLDELVQGLQKRAAQMESLLQSLSKQQRVDLRDLIQAALGDPELQPEIAKLMALLEALDPLSSLKKEYAFSGEGEVDLSDALAVTEELQDLERAEQQVRRAAQSGNLQGIDLDNMQAVLGEEARQDIQRLSRASALLEERGYILKTGSRFELTPKGMRKIGQRALQEIFALIKQDRAGSHAVASPGQGMELTGASRPYESGDPFILDLQRTIMNAVLRGEHPPLRLKAQDLEVRQSEQLAQASTVLMLDLSLSMAMRGNFMAAKKVALALDNLIRTRFPRDQLFIVGFSTYARQMEPEKLAYLRWDEFEPYTNIQHGLMLSQKLLSRVKGGTKQIIMISDGEPTAHLEGGQVFLQYPPSPRTIRQTLAEVRRCTQQSITINTFMLDRNAFLVDFVEQMTRLNRGRVFYTTPERLGKYILVDYMSARRRRVVV